MPSIRPFKVTIPDEALSDLHARLDRTRWAGEFEDPDWAYGANLPYLQALATYWRHDFSWRDAEARVNAFDQYLLELDGLDLHFIHQRSPHENATPLLMCHGWPGSIVEFLEVIPRLTTPEAFGGSPEEAFHVVCPSLPGYGFSAAPSRPGMHPGVIADRHHRLMTALGYDQYLAQGGDWGSPITQLTAVRAPENCRAIHVNLLTPQPPRDVADPMALLRAHEREWLADNERHQRDGAAYSQLQSTRPQTVAAALADSPVGLCAWIAEKFHYWCDCEQDGRRDIRNAVSWDALLTNVSLYWFSNSIAASMRLYKELAQALERREFSLSGRLPVPLGVTVYPREIIKSPRAWAERRGEIIHWAEPARGGHFAAMEQPQAFAEDLRRFAKNARHALGASFR
ncbi:epoxide hydrolase [Phenylobacterium sp. LjRoot225]|uniref:epoxide hydrolase family protein n=1 Tax=Phenylobacterium sp. LjRoot225 TaxID=3342285 RepID=UPI003ED06A29